MNDYEYDKLRYKGVTVFTDPLRRFKLPCPVCGQTLQVMCSHESLNSSQKLGIKCHGVEVYENVKCNPGEPGLNMDKLMDDAFKKLLPKLVTKSEVLGDNERERSLTAKFIEMGEEKEGITTAVLPPTFRRGPDI